MVERKSDNLHDTVNHSRYTRRETNPPYKMSPNFYNWLRFPPPRSQVRSRGEWNGRRGTAEINLSEGGGLNLKERNLISGVFLSLKGFIRARGSLKPPPLLPASLTDIFEK